MVRLGLLPRSSESLEDCDKTRDPRQTPWLRTPTRRRRVPSLSDLDPMAPVTPASWASAPPGTERTQSPLPSSSLDPVGLLCRQCSAVLGCKEDKQTQTLARAPRQKSKVKATPEPATESESDLAAEFFSVAEDGETSPKPRTSGTRPPRGGGARKARSPRSSRDSNISSNMAACTLCSNDYRLGASSGASRGSPGRSNQIRDPGRVDPTQRHMRMALRGHPRASTGSHPCDAYIATSGRRKAVRKPRKSSSVTSGGKPSRLAMRQRSRGRRTRRRPPTRLVLKGFVWTPDLPSAPTEVSGTLWAPLSSSKSGGRAGSFESELSNLSDSCHSHCNPASSLSSTSPAILPHARSGSADPSCSPSTSEARSSSPSSSRDWRMRNRSNSAGRSPRNRSSSLKCQFPCKVAGVPSCLSLQVHGAKGRSSRRAKGGPPSGQRAGGRGRGGRASSLDTDCCCPRPGEAGPNSSPRKRGRKRKRGGKSCCKSRKRERTRSGSRSNSRSRKRRRRGRSRSRGKSRSRGRSHSRGRSRTSRSKSRSERNSSGSPQCQAPCSQRKGKRKPRYGKRKRRARPRAKGRKAAKTAQHVTELCALRLVRHAIWALREPKGCTEAQVRRYIERQYELVEPRKAKPIVHRALLTCVQDTSVQRSPHSKARFLLASSRSRSRSRPALSALDRSLAGRKRRKEVNQSKKVQTEQPSMFSSTARARKYLSRLGGTPLDQDECCGGGKACSSDSDERDKCCVRET